MNVLLVVVVAIFAICAIIGYRKGFIKIAASLAATILTIVLVATLTPICSDLILKTFPIEKSMQEKCYEMFLPEEEVAADKVETSREEQISRIEASELPDAFQQLLLANNNDEIYETLGVATFTDYVGSYLAKLIANIISFIVLSIIVTVAVQLALKALGLVGKIPVVGGVNRLAGAVVCLGIGLIIVWMLFLIVTLLYDTNIGRNCFESIMENKFLKDLYDYNILMNMLTKFR